MLDAIDDLLDSIQEFIQGFLSSIGGIIDNALAPISAFVTEIINNLTGRIDTFIDFIGSIFGEMIARIDSVIETILAQQQAFINNLMALVETVLDTIVQKIAGIIEPIIARIASAIETILTNIAGFITPIFDAITQGFSETLARVESFITVMQERIIGTIDATITRVAGVTQDILATVISETREILQVTREAFDIVGDRLGAGFTVLGDSVRDQLTNWAGFSQKLDWPVASQLSEVVIRRLEEDDSIGPIFRALSPGGQLGLGLIGTIILSSSVGSLTATAVGQAFAGELEKVKQWSMERALPTLISPVDLMELYRRQPSAISYITSQLAKQGFSDQNVGVMRILSEQLVAVNDLLSLWLRNELPETELDQRLREHGVPSASIVELKKLAHPLPPVQDIIHMAVREVFTPEIAAEFGQFEDFPPQFVTEAAKIGITPDIAKNYWAAHWVLPSPQMGFEMLQRGIITQEQLVRLLRALDIMPFWREQLIKLSYNVYTRVDVRRMYDVGVLDEAGVTRAYLDLGYPPDKATKLTEFTVKVSKRNRLEEEPDLKELTRAQIIQFFEEGIFNRDTARGSLIDIGYNVFAADAFLDIKEAQILGELRNARIKAIQTRFGARIITYNQAVEALDELNLEPVYRDTVLSKLEAEFISQFRHPTLAQVTKMLSLGLIDESAFRGHLSLLGYDEKWHDNLVAIAVDDTETEEVGAKKPITLASLQQMVKKQLIDQDTFLRRVQGLGYTDSDAYALLQLAVSP